MSDYLRWSHDSKQRRLVVLRDFGAVVSCSVRRRVYVSWGFRQPLPAPGMLAELASRSWRVLWPTVVGRGRQPNTAQESSRDYRWSACNCLVWDDPHSWRLWWLLSCFQYARMAHDPYWSVDRSWELMIGKERKKKDILLPHMSWPRHTCLWL